MPWQFTMFKQIILLCRPGFEKECAGEIIELANQREFPAYIQTKEQSGVVFLVSSSDAETTDLIESIKFQQLIFTRQWLASHKEVLILPETNRLPTLLHQIKQFRTAFDTELDKVNDITFYDVELDFADTNDGKSLSKFCKQFKPHLLAELKKNQLLSAHAKFRLHLFFIDSQQVYVGLAPVENSAVEAMGIPRLKMPHAAPSRSTLKLDEAIKWFLTPQQQSDLFHLGKTAVDLGSAPGGWSWQLVQRQCLVTAIDNGPMQPELMKTGMVEHLKTDAFTYEPDKKVDWLVCDMAERPLHVCRLISRWLTNKHCENAIFNLKLPMKKRLSSVQECLTLLEHNLSQANIHYSIQAKQLYHDREEITVCILCS